MFRPAKEEIINTLTHGVGALLSVIGAAILLRSAIAAGDVWRFAGCGIYAVALVGVYTSSTLSHGAYAPDWKRLFRMLDQAFIYFLIVGTFTPFALVYLRTGWWLFFLGIMWSIAVAGFLSKILIAHRVECVAVWIYLLLGWMPIVAAIPLLSIVPAQVLWLMLAGGMCYSIGTIFLCNDLKFPIFHAIWHLWVIAGSAIHYFAIYWFVVPVN